jgi:hypothetical protein
MSFISISVHHSVSSLGIFLSASTAHGVVWLPVSLPVSFAFQEVHWFLHPAGAACLLLSVPAFLALQQAFFVGNKLTQLWV